MKDLIDLAVELSKTLDKESNQMAFGLSVTTIVLASLRFAATRDPIAAWQSLFEDLAILGIFAAIYIAYDRWAPGFYRWFNEMAIAISGTNAESLPMAMVKSGGAIFDSVIEALKSEHWWNYIALLINLAPLLFAWLFVMLAALVFLFYVSLGTIQMAVAIVMGKIAFALGMSEFTRGWFKSWLDYTISAGMYMVAAAILQRLMTTTIAKAFGDTISKGLTTPYAGSLTLDMSIFVLILAFEIPKFASMFGGGASASGSAFKSLLAHALVGPELLSGLDAEVQAEIFGAINPTQSPQGVETLTHKVVRQAIATAADFDRKAQRAVFEPVTFAVPSAIHVAAELEPKLDPAASSAISLAAPTPPAESETAARAAATDARGETSIPGPPLPLATAGIDRSSRAASPAAANAAPKAPDQRQMALELPPAAVVNPAEIRQERPGAIVTPAEDRFDEVLRGAPRMISDFFVALQQDVAGGKVKVRWAEKGLVVSKRTIGGYGVASDTLIEHMRRRNLLLANEPMHRMLSRRCRSGLTCIASADATMFRCSSRCRRSTSLTTAGSS
nr:type IV secretion system protein [Burkholderia multivorans]